MNPLNGNAFRFVGSVQSSKSLMNRALLISTYFSNFQVIGKSDSDDVKWMSEAAIKLRASAAGANLPKEWWCGDAGTTFRFLALRLARETGEFFIQGTPRLLERPYQELIQILNQLGCESEMTDLGLRIESKGWKLLGDAVHVRTERSSQFASSLILNSWRLPFPLHVSLSQKTVSEKYWQMTLSLCRDLGMEIDGDKNEYTVQPNQALKKESYQCEMDLSSAFAVVAMALVAGHASLQNFPRQSLQADLKFLQVLEMMGADLNLSGTVLVAGRSQLRGIHVNVLDAPDLFPVLSVLCALADGVSEIRGVGHLKYKESSRVEKCQELLSKMGASLENFGDWVRIYPTQQRGSNKTVEFDPDHDHRMVMAAAVANAAGFSFAIKNPEVVNKSFPEFLQMAGFRQGGATIHEGHGI